MTKSELLNRLESISSQIDHLEVKFQEKTNQEKNKIFSAMTNKEKQLKQRLVWLENKYEEEERKQTLKAEQTRRPLLAIAR
ncbi:hypothetical protein [Lederbergia citrea]|uniref:hypothetical protein n=1 Tax=Lederbergia citrea TaxID=2833581 RepID=UPI001BC99C92|nr:hypothetical protein [Lederbergia citrea]MBS4176598.1 hypothetical protein [Lederbergia citrea]